MTPRFTEEDMIDFALYHSITIFNEPLTIRGELERWKSQQIKASKPMTNNNLIPFSKELWETGEYEAVTRDGMSTLKIHEITEADIYGRCIKGELLDMSLRWLEDGLIYGANDKCSDDLMLRKKTRKKWIPYQEKFVFETKEECERYFSNALEPTKAIEVEI